MLEKSKYNIIFNVGDDGKKIIANALYGTADILSTDEFAAYDSNTFSDPLWKEREYIVSPETEQAEFQRQYVNFLDDRDDDEVQLFFVPTYDCNFGCDYCYQHEYANEKSKHQLEVIDSFFDYVSTEFAARKKYFTLFGGEPLLGSANQLTSISHFLAEAKKRNIETSIVTNGYHLETYIPILQDSLIREVQVTLDGTKDTHDRRRPLKNGTTTFDTIAKGIDRLIEVNIPVNLRMVVDSTNMAELANLSRFAIDRGWTNSAGFKTQLGRNYELHSCQKNASALYSRIQMYSELAKLIEAHPHILEFHKPAFHFVKSLTETNELPGALFDSCPGCKTEWAFDYLGNIYSCTATVGKKDETLGTFYPRVQKNKDAIESWQDRDILAIDECKKCHLALVCGGGCGSIARNSTGRLHAPDCRPVQEIAQIGASLYFDVDGETGN